jgi:uncharacterized protein (TIGR03437 family)
VLGTAKVQTSGSGKGQATQVSLTMPALAAGSYAVQAAYSGDNVYSPSVSTAVNQVVNGAVTPTSPSIKPGGVVTASAYGGYQSIAPGDWIEIYGSNLASKTRPWAWADFTGMTAPMSLEGTSVMIGGQAAFIGYVSPGQVNAQVPSNIAPGSQNLVLTTAAGGSSPYTVTVNSVQPGLLAPASFLAAGKQYVVAVFGDGSMALPPGLVPGVNSRRAKPGDVITLYGIGFGPVNPDTPAGNVAPLSSMLVSSIQFQIGGAPAALSYSGLAPQEVGLYQFNVTVPNVPSSDLTPVTFTQGSLSSAQTIYIAVQN